MKLNKEWHEQHPMPKNPTLEQRLQWHVQHAKACACREVPDAILKELKKRKMSFKPAGQRQAGRS